MAQGLPRRTDMLGDASSTHAGEASLVSASQQAPVSAARFSQVAFWGRPSSDLRYVRGDRAELLARLGIEDVRDQLYAAPRRYLDFSQVSSVLDARVGDEVTCVVTVDRVQVKRPRPRLTIVEVECYDATCALVVSYFGQPWIARQFKRGMLVAFSGKMSMSYGFRRMSNPFHDVLDEGEEGAEPAAHTGKQAMRPQKARILPVHRATEGLTCAWMRRIAAGALADYGACVDFWPAELRARLGLMSLSRALRAIHFPRTLDEAEEARQRLAFDEAALLQIALLVARYAHVPGVHPTRHVRGGARAQALAAAMPFALTADQERAVGEILADMADAHPMSRLLLGDVGTGKTAVATYALGAVADTRTQAAVMAPTSVLAQQYAKKVGPLLTQAQISWALLTGATPAAERARIVQGLSDGSITVAFGTHALLSSDVSFARLSLVVIDEQQRFGVAQRRALREKGRGADLLVMTATPIPRTLALALYGDLDRSYLRERPSAGAGLATHVIGKRDRRRAYDAIQAALDKGQQAYVVCPLVGAQEQDTGADEAAAALARGEDPSDMRAATQERAEVARLFPQAQVSLLTGRMKPAEKAQVMDDFRANRIQILVATTVIEVGVDVPNATVMLIEDGERFGLAQLHQLRGRVGRGSVAGEVFICASTDSSAARERLMALEATNDGFELAEKDLRLRREGDLMGMRQSGDAQLRFVDLARDAELLESAQSVARELLEADAMLSNAQVLPVRDEVIIRFGDVFKEVSGG